MNTDPAAGPKKDTKRRRVTRACDSCRAKKVKCDGRQPCIHCTIYSYSCQYSRGVRNKHVGTDHSDPSPSHLLTTAAMLARSTSFPPTAPQVTDETQFSGPQLNLAKNLVACNNLLKLLLPDLDLDILLESKQLSFDFDKFKSVYLSHVSQAGKPLLEDAVRDYLGGDNGDTQMLDSKTTPSTSPSHHAQQRPPLHHLHTNASSPSISSLEDMVSSHHIKITLPPKLEALHLIKVCWNKACVLLRFYHRPSLIEDVDLLYAIDPNDYTDRQHRVLPFFYLTLACGLLFLDKTDTPLLSATQLEDDGYRYFVSARNLIDFSNVSDVCLMQTIVMMIVYLQCLARLSTCCLYIGIAMRSALKEGLHRNLSSIRKQDISMIEIDTRKRLFYTIYKMDIYVNSLLGLPFSVQDDEFDQELPLNLDDDNITAEAYLLEKQGNRISSAECANHHTRLIIILSHIIRQLYPIKVKDLRPCAPDKIHQKVTALEVELKQWLDQLPSELKPAAVDFDNPASLSHPDNPFLMANCYIRLAFFNCQIMMYRPFIHYVSNGLARNNHHHDPRALIRGRNCIKVARLVVNLASKMIDNDLLTGTYWFSTYTIFFSIACLIYYFHMANYSSGSVLFDDDLNINEIRKDIEVGQRVLHNLKNNSQSSLRIFNILNALFDHLNDHPASNFADRSTKPILASGESGASAFFPVLDKRIRSTVANFDIINSFCADQKIEEHSNAPFFTLKNEIALPDARMGLNVMAARAVDSFAPLSHLPRPSPSPPPLQHQQQQQDHHHHQQQQQQQSIATAQAAIPTDPNAAGLGPDAEQFLFHNPPQFNDSFAFQYDETSPLDYIPGVFDALDTEIFGRILPPYMLEKRSMLDRSNANMSADVPAAVVPPPPPQSTTGVNMASGAGAAPLYYGGMLCDPASHQFDLDPYSASTPGGVYASKQ